MKSLVSLILVLVYILQLTDAATDAVPPNCLGKTFNVDPFFCCKTPKLLDEAVVKQCLQLFPPPSNQKDDIKPDCMSECVMNRTGIFNRKSSVVDDKAMNVFTDNLEENSLWVQVVETAVKECLDQANSRKQVFDTDMSTLKKRFNNDRICSPAAGFIMECVHVSVYKNCPAKIFKSSDTGCAAIKKHLTQCPFFTIFPDGNTKKN
ncbi:uncharacterized protein LOC128736865 [Sabethes cyaneus]|uniref:uncharacterized protein LOC128736865 n=1 Tax=Sabethes cyaneus TaxID=53552 RepID=UPI00237EE28B|nr:uncharacterized protein LOC128736865 [Sabethes cyaneus]